MSLTLCVKTPKPPSVGRIPDKVIADIIANCQGTLILCLRPYEPLKEFALVARTATNEFLAAIHLEGVLGLRAGRGAQVGAAGESREFQSD